MPLIQHPVENTGADFPGRPGYVVSPSGRPAQTMARWARHAGMDSKTAKQRILNEDIAGEWIPADSRRRTRYFVIERPSAETVSGEDEDEDEPVSHAEIGAEGPAPYGSGSEVSERTPQGSDEHDAPHSRDSTPEDERLRREVRTLRNALRGAHITIDGLKQAVTGLQEAQRDLYTPDSPND